MKQSFVKGVQKNALLIIAFVALILFSGNKDAENKQDLTGKCCTGYNIAMNKLKKFMLDSLRGNQFEGSVYSKANLLAAINQIPGDSVYLLNVLKNCNVSQPVDLAITSRQATAVVFAKKPNCYPCPGKACCPQKVCISRINRPCINYEIYKGLSGSEEKVIAANE